MRCSLSLVGCTFLSVAFLVGCAGNRDTDEDGLSDAEEADLGTDPENPDSDGDTLSDGEEVELGTDPLLEDTDEDTYLDQHEIAEGTDPRDGYSRIYEGFWPYYPYKDDLEQVAVSDLPPAKGEQPMRWMAYDQYGDLVDFYDFADVQVPILLEMVAFW